MEYEWPSTSKADDEAVGGLIVYREFKNVSRADALGAVLSTRNECDAHALPPEPRDPMRSRVSESQLPIAVGAFITTTGAVGTAGATMVTFCEGTYGHVEHDETSEADCEH
jgi:hypothetical protein